MPDVDIAPLLRLNALMLCLQCSELRVDHAVSASVGPHEGDRFDRHGRRLWVYAGQFAACLAEERDMRRESFSIERNIMLCQRPAGIFARLRQKFFVL